MDASLTELDELANRCRDERARSYILEAIASYKGGAYRAAIVSTWIAVCFDLIEKLRELALSGDAEAERHVEELERTRKANDLPKALRFEREILIQARDKFELISPLEFIDLERLQADRNRCAHPSLVSEEQAYAPSPELARSHIHAGVTHVLQHPPAQGKYALERLVREIDSEYFPTEVTLAVKAFSSGPLHRPRESLVRNFTLILTKRLLVEGVSGKPLFRTVTALDAVRTMHAQHTEAVLRSKLPAMFRSLEDAQLSRAVVFLERVPKTWGYLTDDIQLRLQHFVQDLPTSFTDDLEFLLAFEPLRAAAERRVSWAKKEDLIGNFYLALPTKIGDRLIKLLLDAPNGGEADEIAAALAWDVSDLSPDQVKRLLSKARSNSHLLRSQKFAHLIGRIRERDVLPQSQLDGLLTSSGLSEFLVIPETDDDIPF